MNVAYTARYQAYRQQTEQQLFSQFIQCSQRRKLLAWSPEYSLRSQDHAGEVAGRTLYGSCS